MPTIVVSVKGIAEGIAVLLLGRTACSRKMNAVSLHCFETRSLTSAVHPSVVFDSTVGNENISGGDNTPTVDDAGVTFWLGVSTPRTIDRAVCVHIAILHSRPGSLYDQQPEPSHEVALRAVVSHASRGGHMNHMHASTAHPGDYACKATLFRATSAPAKARQSLLSPGIEPAGLRCPACRAGGPCLAHPSSRSTEVDKAKGTATGQKHQRKRAASKDEVSNEECLVGASAPRVIAIQRGVPSGR